MLKELFESTFYVTFHPKSKLTIALEEQVHLGKFSLVDPKACRDCKFKCSDAEDGREQLLVNAKSEVHVMSVDSVMNNIAEDVGDTCDYMLDDNEKVALVEMTCSSSRYVGSKRQKARGQLYNTICLLATNPDLRKHIENEDIRYAIFSWKETYPKDDGTDPVENIMMGMTKMTDEVYSPDNVSKFDFNFWLKEIRYPDSLEW